jgi:hypothetical protein
MPTDLPGQELFMNEWLQAFASNIQKNIHKIDQSDPNTLLLKRLCQVITHKHSRTYAENLTLYQRALTLVGNIYLENKGKFKNQETKSTYAFIFEAIYENECMLNIQANADKKTQLNNALSSPNAIKDNFAQARFNENFLAKYGSLLINPLAKYLFILPFLIIYPLAVIAAPFSSQARQIALQPIRSIKAFLSYAPLIEGRLPFLGQDFQNITPSLKRINMGHPIVNGKLHPAFQGYVATHPNYLYIGNLKALNKQTGLGYALSFFNPMGEKNAEHQREKIIRNGLPSGQYIQLPADNHFLFNGLDKEKALLSSSVSPKKTDRLKEIQDSLIYDQNDCFIPETIKQKLGIDRNDVDGSRQNITILLQHTATCLGIDMQKGFDTLDHKEQLAIKLAFFKGVLPAAIAQVAQCSSFAGVCKDGIDRGATTGIMTRLASLKIQFQLDEHGHMNYKQDPVINTTLKIDPQLLYIETAIGAALAKGREVNVHRHVLEMFIKKSGLLLDTFAPHIVDSATDDSTNTPVTYKPQDHPHLISHVLEISPENKTSSDDSVPKNP